MYRKVPKTIHVLKTYKENIKKLYTMFNNGNQVHAHGNEKKASQIIIDLQDKNAKLRIGLGKLLQLCKNTKMNE